MAINVSGEMSVKQKVRANLFGGANSYTGNPTAIVNAATTASGLWRLSVSGTAVFTISGTGATAAASNVNISGGTTTFSGLQGLIQSIVPSNVVVLVPGGPANFIYQTTADILLSSGCQLVVSGAVNAPAGALTNVFISAADFASAYPSYTGTPNTTPSWVDDATVHTNIIYGFGTVVASGVGSQTFQGQVRQVQTGNGPDGSLETQQWNGYFAVYSGSLTQTQQKNTRTQQC